MVVSSTIPQVATGSMDRDNTGGGDSKEITGLKFKVVECQVNVHNEFWFYHNKYFAASKPTSTTPLHPPLPWISESPLLHRCQRLRHCTMPSTGRIVGAYMNALIHFTSFQKEMLVFRSSPDFAGGNSTAVFPDIDTDGREARSRRTRKAGEGESTHLHTSYWPELGKIYRYL